MIASFVQEVGIPQAVDTFEAAVREHQAMVFSVAYHFLQDHAVAEELAQEVFLELYRHWDEIESREHRIH